MASQPGKLAALVSPVFLRLALGVTFVWAGAGKLGGEITIQGQDAAILANLGVIVPVPRASLTPAALPPPGIPQSTSPVETKPSTKPETKSPGKPESKPEAKPEQKPKSGSVPSSRGGSGGGSGGASTRSASADGVDLGGILPAMQTGVAGGESTTGNVSPGNSGATGPRYSASDFPEPLVVKRVYRLALTMVKAAFPMPSRDGKSPTPSAHWPAQGGMNPWVVYLAWMAAFVELVAGIGLLVGFFTRTAAFFVAMIMLNAIWLTEIGPAIASGQTALGFLPSRTWHDPAAWMALLWQVSILASSLAIMFAGAGGLSIDRAMGAVGGFGGGKAKAKVEEDED